MLRLTDRDVAVLTTVGRFRMLSRAQLKVWRFAEVSEPVVTRFVDRMESAGYLGAKRLGGNGELVLWLTRRGANLLADHGVPPSDLFPATNPSAAKDFEHTSAIMETATWLALRRPRPDELLPA